MGIYLCKENTYFEAGTLEISHYFMALLILYTLIEIFMIWVTIRTIRSQPQILKNGFMIIFYICINLVFIRNILSFMGGTFICYSKTLYFIIAEYFYILKDVLPFIMSYRIAVMLQLAEVQYFGSKHFAKIILGLLAVDLTFYTTYFIYDAATGIVLWNIMIATIFGLIILSFAFNYPIYQMINYIKQYSEVVNADIELAKWYTLALGVNGYFVTRTSYIVLAGIYRFSDKFGVMNQDPLYGSFMLVYYILTEIFPFVSIFIVITGSINASNEVKKEDEYSASIYSS